VKSYFRRLLSLTAYLGLLVPTFAQSESDWGSWSAIQGTKVFDRSYVMLRGELRTMNNFSTTECWFVSAGGGYSITKWLKGELSYEFWKLPPLEGNPTVHKGVLAFTGILAKDNLAVLLREKYEFTYPENTGVVSNILRSRLRCQYKIGKFTPYLMYEFFNDFEGHGWIRSLHYIGSEFTLGKKHTLDLFYMYHLYDIGGDTGARNTLGISYYFKF